MHYAKLVKSCYGTYINSWLLNLVRFSTPKYETFFKDDANHDPQWTEEQILCANFVFNNVKIGKYRK